MQLSIITEKARIQKRTEGAQNYLRENERNYFHINFFFFVKNIISPGTKDFL